MTQRLRRALQRGGVAAQIRPEAWGVWRGQDRRGRMIGTLSGAEVDIMRLRGELKPSGDDHPQVLTWSGAPEEVKPPSNIQAPDLSIEDKAPRTPLLEALLLGHHNRDERERIRSSCQNYLQDLELVAAGPQHTTMNWEAFSAGDRVKGGGGYDPLQRARYQKRAKARIADIREHLSEADFTFMEKLLRNDTTRAGFARTYQQRPALIDRRALLILRVLMNAYASK